MNESAPAPSHVSSGGKASPRSVEAAGGNCEDLPGLRELVWRDYLKRVAGGDESALSALYDETCSIVYSLAYRVLREAGTAEEVTLDVYTQVWRSAASFDSSRGSVFSWLTMLARSRSIDRLRHWANRAGREEPIDEASGIASPRAGPEEQASWEQQRKRVCDALNVLPPEQRQVIELGYFSGLSQGEIADEIGIPLGTVKTRVRLGMLKLREALA